MKVMEAKAQPRGSSSVVVMRLLAVVAMALLIGVVIAYGIHRLKVTNIDFVLSPTLTDSQKKDIHQLIAESTVEEIDTNQLMKAIEELSWVDDVRIRTSIDHYFIDVNLFIPVATLNNRWFLSALGKRKNIVNKSGYTALTKYELNAEQQQTLLPQVKKLQKKLQDIEIVVQAVRVSPAGNWSVEIDSGATIYFGAKGFDEKVATLQRLLPEIQTKGEPLRIDLRNQFGVAVGY